MKRSIFSSSRIMNCTGDWLFAHHDDPELQIIEGSFAFESFDGSDEPRRNIRVEGVFSCSRGEAFK